ncbi:MAG TPA: RNA polymerase sigma factor [Bacillales bacterium]|nr:RNA polymerase sigma factor [Bacillales bacterium]
MTNENRVENESLIASLHPELSKYCRMVAGTPWDGEDLMQDTLFKAFNAKTSLKEHPAPKAYLFRIATNTWIDHCRKNKRPVDTYEEEKNAESGTESEFEAIEAVESLVHRLPPRQVAIVLLIDVFGFSALDAADMLGTTEGALKAALHRARAALRRVKNQEEKAQKRLKSKSAAELIDLFLKAFQRFDPSEVIHVYHSLQEQGIAIQRVAHGRTLTFQFQDPDGNVFSVVASA